MFRSRAQVSAFTFSTFMGSIYKKNTHLSDQGAQFSHHYAQPFFPEWALQKPENDKS